MNWTALELTLVVASPGLLALAFVAIYAIAETLVPSINPEN